jgi:signal transduction histidine kinase/CheY-like chemotaxis protein
VAEHTSYDVEYRAVHSDGSIRWIHAIGRAFYNEAGEPTRFDGITIDISDRKQAELELERARREAVEANQAKDHFLAALSHELRTPLTPVLMTVAALQQDETVPDSVRAELSGIHRHVELEARLIDDLLDLTRVTRGKLVLHRNVVDVNELLEHAVETCCGEDIAHRRMKISVRPEAREHHTFGDPARLHQVMCNLLNNALKFTPDGGTIELISSNPQPGTIGICVADSGMGITAELLPRLFDAFEQGNPAVTRRFGGLGLGLAISKAIVDLHGGTLRAESDGKGRGAKFTLELEAVAAPQAEETTSAPHLPLFTQPLRILLTEDHEATRAILTRLLTRAGHHVRAAGNVSDALALAAQHTFDLLVSDLGLPDGHGSDLMRELRDRYGLRGIALSGYGMEEDVRESAAAGFALHLTKPVEWRRLEAALSTFGSEMTSAPQPMAVQ